MKYYLLITALLVSHLLIAQKTWNHRIPVTGITPNTRVVGANVQDGRLWVTGSRNAVELDELGTITGYTVFPNSSLYYNYFSKKLDAQTGKPFFVVGARKLTSNMGNYHLQIVEPGMGLVSEIVLEDSLVPLQNNAPIVLEVGDSNLLVFGLRTLVSIRRHGMSGFSEEWGNNLPYSQGNPKAAVATPNGFIMLTDAGEVAGINTQGNPQFILQHPARSYYGAVLTSDGILACGRDTGEFALLAKFDLNGQLIWTKTYARGVFYDVRTDAQNNIFCTGNSDLGNILLQKNNEQGEGIWSNIFQAGRGIRLFPLSADHWAVVYQYGTSYSATAVMCSDEAGNTPPINLAYYTNNRPFRTGGISGGFAPTGSLFFDGTGVAPISPPDTGAATVFSLAPWLAGKGPDEQFHLLAEDYPTNSSFDLQSGFIGGKTGDFKRVWRTTRDEIRELRSDFLADNKLDRLVPYDLLTWPGKGNLHNQYNIDFTRIETDPQLQSAPFVDWNGDGIYNVYDGDYPAIKGDQMLWWPLNDSIVHLNSIGLPLGVDMAISLYAYNCSENESLKNTIMADIQTINRSGLDYDSVYMAWFIDFDLGCPEDDYIGTMPDINSVYVYNQDAFDNNCTAAHFDEHIPVQTVTFPNATLDHCMYFNNNINNPAPATTDPSNIEERLNYIMGKWKNGIPLTPGGSGYNPSSSIPTDFVFPANPADPSGWNMCNANLPYGDRRMLPSKGPFSLGASDTLNTTIIFTTHHNIPHPCPDVFGLVKPAVQNITDWTNAGVMDQIPDLGALQFLPQGQALNLSSGNYPGATYQWSNGANTPGISVTQPGRYAVTVTTEAGCAYTDVVEVLGGGSGVHAAADAPSWSISPNPASDAVQVQCDECRAPTQCVLRNMLGVQLASTSLEGPSGRLAVQQLPAGVYSLELWQDDRFTSAQKNVQVK